MAESSKKSEGSAYARAGVDIDAQEEALDRIKSLVRSTFTPGVLSEQGSFGGLFRLPDGLREPVLVSSADGVGTKLMVASMAKDYSTVGRDLVNHCVNDILVQGAQPLFFLDYVGAGVLEPDSMADLVTGVAAGCRENECALLGGETAEMPGFYKPGDYELVGFVVGLVDRDQLVDGSRVESGDVVLGLPSAGLHTNGFSLARDVLFDRLRLGLEDPLPIEGAGTVREALLAPHLSYLPAIRPFLGDAGLHAMAHITGGGLLDNLPRVLPAGLGARLDRETWEVPPIFRILQEGGAVSDREMFRVFNMGVGMTLVVSEDRHEELCRSLRERGHRAEVIGRIEPGEEPVMISGLEW